MALKRKRSVLDDSPSSTSTSWTSSSSRDSTSPSPTGPMCVDGPTYIERAVMPQPRNGWEYGGSSLAAAVGSRTRKRFRSNRPDDAIVHENTINMLFAAQRHHPDASPLPSHDQAPRHREPTQRSTLHSFWQLPPSAPRLAAQQLPPDELEASRCEDCEGRLVRQDEMDLDMRDEFEYACVSCQRQVCDMCSVSSTGRRCLQCTAG